jgi:hypothetical protein
VKTIFTVIVLAWLSVAVFAQNNPVPTVDAPVYPQAVVPGSGAFTLTVRGANFVSGAVVNWNGSARNTTYIFAGELQAQITAADVASAGSALITVTNPPPGGGLSSSSYGTVEIHQPVATLTVGQAHTYGGTKYRPQLFTADLNGDNRPDIVELDYGVTVQLNNGDGTFTKTASIPIPGQPTDVSFGDFNNDGHLDFVVVIYDKGSVVVALGDGTGKFHQVPALGPFNSPVETAVGDFNRDGNLDLILVTYSASSGLGPEILLGNGDGTFQPQQTIASTYYADNLAPADFDGDGILDLALLDQGKNQIAVLLGNGDGTFQPPIETQTVYGQMLAGDFNNDGALDFAFFDSGGPIPVGIALGNGDGTFQLPQYYSTSLNGATPVLILGDFNSDGSTDVLTYGESTYTAAFLAGNGDGTLQRASRLTLPGSRQKTSQSTGDFNGDGLLDFAIGANGGAEVFLQGP